MHFTDVSKVTCSLPVVWLCLSVSCYQKFVAIRSSLLIVCLPRLPTLTILWLFTHSFIDYYKYNYFCFLPFGGITFHLGFNELAVYFVIGTGTSTACGAMGRPFFSANFISLDGIVTLSFIL